MEKKCKTCKWYYDNKCYNKDFRESIQGNTPEDEFIELTESGILEGYIRENKENQAYELAYKVLERLYELDYIKKSKKKLWDFKNVDDSEEFLNEFTETMDSIISSFVMNRIKDIKMEYEINSEFGCRFWE